MLVGSNLSSHALGVSNSRFSLKISPFEQRDVIGQVTVGHVTVGLAVCSFLYM